MKTLYKKSVSGKINIWTCELKIKKKGESKLLPFSEKYFKKGYHPVFISRTGFKGMKQRQNIVDIKRNRKGYETIFDYAMEYMRQKIREKIKKFEFSESETEAQESVSLRPMLLGNYNDQRGRIKIADYVLQPKLDGVRCIIYFRKDIELYSRTMKKISNLEHIERDIIKLVGNVSKSLILDGELYAENLNLQRINQIISKKKNLSEKDKKDKLLLSYNIFDVADYKKIEWGFVDRYKYLQKMFGNKKFKNIHLVPTFDSAKTEDELESTHKKLVSDGYEGVVMRKKTGNYLFGRRARTEILKKKFKLRGTFEVVDFTSEKKGDRNGAIIWICKTLGGKTFNVIPELPIEIRKEKYIDAKNNPEKYIGKKIEISYYELTRDGIPRNANSKT